MGELGDDPHADGEFAALETQHQRRQRQRQRADDDRGEEQRRVDADAGIGEPHGEIGAEAEERLLADRHQSAIADQRVPHHREDHVNEQRRQPVDAVGAEPQRPERQQTAATAATASATRDSRVQRSMTRAGGALMPSS